MMPLYHYTSCYQLGLILKEGQIRLTQSNLLKPKNPHFVTDDEGILTVADETDIFSPVVWFTTFFDFDRAVDCGVSKEKTECVIKIFNPDPKIFIKWDKWAVANKIEKDWFNTLKKTAPLWRSFYITEDPVLIKNDGCGIMFRPDVAEQLNA